MSRIEQQPLMPSLLDRLVDASLQGSAGRAWYGAPQMVEAVQRDLEDLLNTRETHQGLCEGFPELGRSLIAYGLPDLSSIHAATQQQREEIGRSIEAVIRQFEPRLKDVRAVLLKSDDEKQRSIRFRVEARLSVDPAPDVAFDTTLELATGYYSVQRSDS
jgi:type VI secretion system protein ImpF